MENPNIVFTFNIQLRGIGQTAEDAWTDATTGFTLDPGVAGEDGKICSEDEQEEAQEYWPKEDWRYEVQNDDTKLGYREWLEHKIESHLDDLEP